MNRFGYESLQAGNIQAAIDLFKLNVTAYPDSPNVYDSLGEAYMKAGQKELAIQNYEMSLHLDPKNQNAIDSLKKLNQTK